MLQLFRKVSCSEQYIHKARQIESHNSRARTQGTFERKSPRRRCQQARNWSTSSACIGLQQRRSWICRFRGTPHWTGSRLSL